jgi:hypothetical protein
LHPHSASREHHQALLFLLARGSATAMSYFDVFDALEFFYNHHMFSIDKVFYRDSHVAHFTRVSKVVSDLVECGFLYLQERDRNRAQWQLSLKIPREFLIEQLKVSSSTVTPPTLFCFNLTCA